MDNKRMRVSISFKQQYRHIYEHLKSVPNKSDYVAQAVEAHMNNESMALHDQIRKIVMEILQKSSVSHENHISALQNGNSISTEDADLLNQLF